MSDPTIKKQTQRSTPAYGKKKSKKITRDYLHNSGLYYLQRFASSRNNFLRVMERKIKKSCYDHPEQNLENCLTLLHEVTENFERCGLLNDSLYIDGMIDSMRRRGVSRSIILQKLSLKGIHQDITLQKLTEKSDTPETEMTAALKFAKKKKLGPFGNKSGPDQAKKNFSAFARAGYSYDIARKILNSEIDEFL